MSETEPPELYHNQPPNFRISLGDRAEGFDHQAAAHKRSSWHTTMTSFPSSNASHSCIIIPCSTGQVCGSSGNFSYDLHRLNTEIAGHTPTALTWEHLGDYTSPSTFPGFCRAKTFVPKKD
jgi:hypothetical protein